MRRSRTMQCLTRSAEWRKWDIILELEQREGDPAPQFQLSYTSIDVDWGGEVISYPYTTSARIYSYDLSTGTHLVKVRMTRPEVNNFPRLVFGATSNTAATTALMPQVKKVMKCDMRKLGSMQYMFCKSPRLESVCKITGTHDIYVGTYMFYMCPNLRGTLAFDDLAECQNISYLAPYSAIDELDLGASGVPNTTSLASLVLNCAELKKARVGRIDTVGSMNSAFSGCANLKELDLGPIPESCTIMDGAFQMVPAIREMEIGDLPNCTSVLNAFNSCVNLRSLKIGNAPVCTSTQAMCYGCTALESAEVDFSEATLKNAYQMFFRCTSLKRVTGNIIWAADGPTSTTGFSQIFYQCYDLENIPEMYPVGGFTRFSVANATLVNEFFACRSLTGNAPEWMWTEWPGTGSVANCFYACFKLDNYDDIPDAYKGNIRI